MSTTGWLREERASVAVEQILDAASGLFATRGVSAVGMAEVADAAGCSRATLYRYFANRDALRAAYVHREARRVGAEVARRVAAIDRPRPQLVEAVTLSLRLVRDDPVLAAWFDLDASGATARLARSSDVIGDLVGTMLGDPTDPAVRRRARWVVRVVVSLLTDPEPEPVGERALIEEFVVPVVVD